MSNGAMRWVYVKCPFFHKDDKSSIVCEGCEENSSVRQTFANKEKRQQWQKKYCNDTHSCCNCPVYQIANEKYEE